MTLPSAVYSSKASANFSRNSRNSASDHPGDLYVAGSRFSISSAVCVVIRTYLPTGTASNGGKPAAETAGATESFFVGA